MDLKIEQKGDIREHIYSLPDTYIGSVIPETRLEWVVEDLNSPHTSKFIQKEINIIDGIIQLFNEIRANAIDNVWRSREANVSVKEIKFYISKKEISVYNDGLTIPITKQVNKRTNEEIYKPQLVFSEFWTSTNYGMEARKTAGKNGYGAKLVNVFSKNSIPFQSKEPLLENKLSHTVLSISCMLFAVTTFSVSVLSSVFAGADDSLRSSLNALRTSRSVFPSSASAMG